MMALRMAALASLLVTIGCEPRVEGEVLPTEREAPVRADWVRVEHPEYPFSLELPEETAVYRTGKFSLGWPRSRGRERMEFTLFGIRPIPGPRVAYHALQIAFFWITDDAEGADAATLRTLARRTPEAHQVERFLRAVFYSGMSVELTDRGSDRVSGHPARRTAVTWQAAGGTPDERPIEGEVILVPVSPLAALVVIARFDAAATSQERNEVFRRILRSVRLRGALRT